MDFLKELPEKFPNDVLENCKTIQKRMATGIAQAISKEIAEKIPNGVTERIC